MDSLRTQIATCSDIGAFFRELLFDNVALAVPNLPSETIIRAAGILAQVVKTTSYLGVEEDQIAGGPTLPVLADLYAQAVASPQKPVRRARIQHLAERAFSTFTLFPDRLRRNGGEESLKYCMDMGKIGFSYLSDVNADGQGEMYAKLSEHFYTLAYYSNRAIYPEQQPLLLEDQEQASRQNQPVTLSALVQASELILAPPGSTIN